VLVSFFADQGTSGLQEFGAGAVTLIAFGLAARRIKFCGHLLDFIYYLFYS
jgi:hypothetical protein